MSYTRGYTERMNGGHTVSHTKTAVSLPDDLFALLQQSAEAEGAPRSAIVVRALRSYFDAVSAGDFKARMNAVYAAPWTEEELREEEALARARRTAARRIGEMLRDSEEETWPSGK